ncbi:DNA-directed RNA polymerase II subunit H [Microbotryum lychnidis-dioicae p1A1 Lamole]|uniref:DNA-directed RNA polymerases I, II, and III subunit RPABC3 n=1 Tax=Microbotryum lychnidis-dioicae (strain p1A1 Lamole / MvSl-1064) TaxID=683840 RepID=U5H8N9_USTV1|nr:DNA-directed RNA polymerase II subunit H [Microbotryum lychnidis-dioicae p1A1 Lamole]|eukprot:KDE06038.1 DNA-directed RNA polymerase II subunit H [Microbotryum lychnidis-dioicae p1A1 Lamole]
MSSSQTSAFLFQDMFTTTDVDRDGKKFDRVSRLTARSSNYDMDLTLDVNIDLLPITPQTTFTLALTSSLLPEGEKETAGGWRAGIEGGIADEWEYVMYGKVYKFDQDTQERVTAYASFGGLLMALSGSYRHVSNVTVGENVYLLLRR